MHQPFSTNIQLLCKNYSYNWIYMVQLKIDRNIVRGGIIDIPNNVCAKQLIQKKRVGLWRRMILDVYN